MGLSKGAKGNNPAGRPKGSKNKGTKELRQRINTFLSDNWEDLLSDFKKLEPKDKLAFYEKLLQYGLPKMHHTEIIAEVQDNRGALLSIFPMDADFESLDQDQLDDIMNDIKMISDE